jgi:hypothetical protein
MSSESKKQNEDPDLKLIEEIRSRVKNIQSGKVKDIKLNLKKGFIGIVYLPYVLKSSNTTKEVGKSERVGGANTPDWKNEEQVKEYLDNLYTEYSFQCLSERLPDGIIKINTYNFSKDLLTF